MSIVSVLFLFTIIFQMLKMHRFFTLLTIPFENLTFYCKYFQFFHSESTLYVQLKNNMKYGISHRQSENFNKLKVIGMNLTLSFTVQLSAASLTHLNIIKSIN